MSEDEGEKTSKSRTFSQHSDFHQVVLRVLQPESIKEAMKRGNVGGILWQRDCCGSWGGF